MADTRTFQIRQARPEEADALARLHVAVWRATYRDYATPEALELLDDARRLPYWTKAVAQHGKEAGVWVADGEGEIKGVISFGPSQHEAFGGRTEIKHLYVAENAQGYGLGRRLLETVLDQGDLGGFALAVVRQNTQARQFYKRMGGVERGTFVDPGPLWRSENIVVVWD